MFVIKGFFFYKDFIFRTTAELQGITTLQSGMPVFRCVVFAMMRMMTVATLSKTHVSLLYVIAETMVMRYNAESHI